MVVEVERFVPVAVVACGERCRWFDVTVVRVVSPAAHAGRELWIHRERGRPRLPSSSPPAAGSLYTVVIDPRWLDEERWLLEDALSLTPLTDRPGE